MGPTAVVGGNTDRRKLVAAYSHLEDGEVPSLAANDDAPTVEVAAKIEVPGPLANQSSFF
jgi:hypothetical protein